MSRPDMINTVPGVIITCVETYYRAPIDELEPERKQIVRELLSSHLDMTKDEVNDTFRLWPRSTDRSKNHKIDYESEWQELDAVLTMVMYPDEDMEFHP